MNNTKLPLRDWSRLAAFDNLKPAQELEALLEDHWFVVRLYDERKLQRYWFLARPCAGVCVQVPEESIPAVQEFLDTHPEANALLRSAVHCPSCHSTRVHYPQMTRKNVLPTLVAHGLVGLGFMRHECYCEDCHFTWARRTHRPSRVKRSPNIALFSTPRHSGRGH